MMPWGKIIGGVAGFALAGPFGLGPVGAIVGAALGHAADAGGLGPLRQAFRASPLGRAAPPSAAQIASLFGRREQVFAVGIVVLAAKLAKCDGSVNRAEIDAFKTVFAIPPQSLQDIGRLFDQSRQTADGFEEYASQLGERFPDNLGLLEDVLAALFRIAAADGPVNIREQEFLMTVCHRFGLNRAAWERVGSGASRQSGLDDPYDLLGVARGADAEELRAAWKQLMRENHPDTLAARGVPPEFIAKASDKVARINAAWDQIKRERGL